MFNEFIDILRCFENINIRVSTTLTTVKHQSMTCGFMKKGLDRPNFFSFFHDFCSRVLDRERERNREKLQTHRLAHTHMHAHAHMHAHTYTHRTGNARTDTHKARDACAHTRMEREREREERERFSLMISRQKQNYRDQSNHTENRGRKTM